MLKARANSSYHIGFPDPLNNDIIKFSHYLGIDSSLPIHGVSNHQQSRQQQISSQTIAQEYNTALHYTAISIRRACKIIVKCLECDKGIFTLLFIITTIKLIF